MWNWTFSSEKLGSYVEVRGTGDAGAVLVCGGPPLRFALSSWALEGWLGLESGYCQGSKPAIATIAKVNPPSLLARLPPDPALASSL